MTRWTPRQLASSGLVATLLAGLLVLAVRADGNVVPDLDLHDAGIWVINESKGLVGRTNAEIRAVDLRVDAGGGDFDVLQSGATILVRSVSPASVLIGIDPARGEVVEGPELPTDALVSLGGTTAALLDPGTGRLLIAPADSSAAASGLDPAEGRPAHTVEGKRGALAVDVDGVTHVLDDATGQLTSWTQTGEQIGSFAIEGDLPGSSLTAVGGRPVVLTADGRIVVAGGRTVSLEGRGDNATLQQPGPDAAHVLVATDAALLRVPLDGGVPEELFRARSGNPAAPVFVAGCAYGAWTDDARWAVACPGLPVRDGIDGQMDPGGELRFRVNRDRVTLNNLADGTQLLFTDDDTPTFLSDVWPEALEFETDDEEEESDETDAESADEDCADGEDDANEPPQLVEMAVRTRADRPLVVHPLREAEDANCDTLLIDEVMVEDASAGRVEIIEDRRAVQVRPAPGLRQLRFGYTASDGRGGTAASTVTVDVVGEGENTAPVLGPSEETTVVTGGSVTHNVLATAMDPEGDPLRLVRVEPAGSVQFNPRGEIVYTAPPLPGEDELTFVVSDGRPRGEATGRLRITIEPHTSNLDPDARNDSASAIVGRAAVVDVLANDSDANGDDLRVVSATALGTDDVTVRFSPGSPFVHVAAQRAGSVNVRYQVTDGKAPAAAVLRVDFTEPIEQRPPTAVRDEVFLTASVPAFVPVLDNDVDPNGEVLVVTAVEDLPQPSPISVAIVQRSIIKISSATALTESVEFRYRITDGSNEDLGVVLVEPAPVLPANRPPVVRPDEFTVRAGGIAVLPVLDNDSDPEGDTLVLEAPEEVDDATGAEDGRLFLTGGQLRYEAPAEPKATVELDYDVLDGAGNNASGRLFLHVLPADSERNRPPDAPELVGRTVAGGEIRLAVPLGILDPDGDSVRLVGIEGDTRHGTARVEDDGLTIVYGADDNASGTDEFTYRVADAFDAEATGTVLIGVAPKSTVNNPPVVVDDEVIVERGATVDIAVLANDDDPDGDDLSISTAEPDLPDPPAGQAVIGGDVIEYTAPVETDLEEESFLYTADDGRGMARSARVTVIFKRDDLNHPPMPDDEVLEPQKPGALVRIPVLEGDTDPDGDQLRLMSASYPGANVVGDVLELAMPERPLQFTYLVTDGRPRSTDEDDLATARGAVFVPVVTEDDLPPVVRPESGIEVAAGESVTIDVLENDEDPEGEDVHLIDVSPGRNGRTATNDQGQVIFTASDPHYVGDAGFSYEVGDTSDPATANIASGTVEITITGSAQNTPPVLSTLTVEVPAGGERQVDLAASVIDPDPGQRHTFTVSGGGDGVDAAIEGGSRLVVSATRRAEPGPADPLAVTVNDGEASTEGSIAVVVLTADEPLAVLGADEAETIQGEPVTIAVLENDANPYPTPLAIRSVSDPTNDAGSATAGSAGRITFTPTASFFGRTQFTYRVADETGDAAREVEATVTVVVIGRPDAPAAPACVGGETRAVRVQWAAPNANGAPITEYRVRISSPAGEREEIFDNSTVQTVEGLENGTAYQFQVAAVNRAVTESGAEPTFSAQSPPCIPDEVPGQPDPPVTEFGDRQLEITWTAPVNEGSPITGYVLTNTTTGQTKQLGPSTTSDTWTGLTNGTSYQFTVTAVNARGEGPASELSTGDSIPAGKPLTPAAPTVPQTVGDRDKFLLVTWQWSPNQDNGDAVAAFRVTSYRNGAIDNVVDLNDGGARSHRFDTENGVTYTFTVQAKNKADWSDPSRQSAPAVSAAPPLAPNAPTATEGDRETVLSYTAPDDNGSAITGYEYSQNDGGWQTLASNGRITGLTNGTSYSFRIRAINADGDGASSPASDTIRPYGAPGTPSVSASVSGRRIDWSWPPVDGNGRDIVRYEIHLDSGGWTSNGTSRTFSREFGFGETHTLRVRAVSSGSDPARNTSGEGSATAKTPNPTATIVDSGTFRSCESNSAATCEVKDLRVESFPANASFTVKCVFSDGTDPRNFSISTDGNGYGYRSGPCHAGGGVSLSYHVYGNGVDVSTGTAAGRSG